MKTNNSLEMKKTRCNNNNGKLPYKEFECENGSIKTLFVRDDLVLDRMKIHIDTMIIKTA